MTRREDGKVISLQKERQRRAIGEFLAGNGIERPWSYPEIDLVGNVVRIDCLGFGRGERPKDTVAVMFSQVSSGRDIGVGYLHLSRRQWARIRDRVDLFFDTIPSTGKK